MMWNRRRAARAARAAERTELAVAAERNRIAREMHDIVAHSLSVIIVQAEGGRYAAAADPEAALRALATIAETGRAALTDTRRILGLLRDQSQTERAPLGTDGLSALVASLRAGGLDIAHIRTGQPRLLPPAASVAAYRICQESLTNVIKHAADSPLVTVSESWSEAGLCLTITNTRGAGIRRPVSVPGSGQGLIGMRERAELFGGSVQAGPTADGGYRVRAEIPLPADTPATVEPLK